MNEEGRIVDFSEKKIIIGLYNEKIWREQMEKRASTCLNSRWCSRHYNNIIAHANTGARNIVDEIPRWVAMTTERTRPNMIESLALLANPIPVQTECRCPSLLTCASAWPRSGSFFPPNKFVSPRFYSNIFIYIHLVYFGNNALFWIDWQHWCGKGRIPKVDPH